MRIDKYAQENTVRMEKRLNTSSYDGLSHAEAAERRKNFGKNRILPCGKSCFLPFLAQIARTGSLPLMLVCVAVFLLTAPMTALFIGGLYLLYLVVLLLLSAYRNREKRALDEALLPPVKIVREGKTISVSPEMLVQGDLLVLKEGDVLQCYAHLITESPIKVFCRRGTEKKLLVKQGGACFDTAEESYNFLMPGDIIREGEARAFVTEYADPASEEELVSDTVSAQGAVCRMASRVTLILVMLMLLAAFLYSRRSEQIHLLYHAITVSAVLLAFSPMDFIVLFCDVIFLAENRRLLRAEQAFLADLTVAERLSEVDSFVLSTRSVYRSARFSVRYFETGNGKRFSYHTSGGAPEVSLVCSAINEIHKKEAFGPEERNLRSYCKKHAKNVDGLRLHTVTSNRNGLSLASFTNQTTGRAFSLLGGDAEWLIREASYISEAGRTRILDAKTKETMLAAVRKKKANGYHLVAYAETQVRAVERSFPSSFPDMKLLGMFVLSEVPDAKISGTLRTLAAEGKKVFLLHDGDDPSWIKQEISLLDHASVIDGGSPAFAEEIGIYATDPDISFCIGVHFSASQQAQLVHALNKAGHRVAAAGSELFDHRMLCAASVGFIPLDEGKVKVSPIMRISGAIYAKEHISSQVGCVRKATGLLGAFGLTTSYLCAALISRVAVAALGFFFGVSLLSAFWYACLGSFLDLAAVWILSHSRTKENHHIDDTLKRVKEQSGSFFISALCGAMVTGAMSLLIAHFPARFGFDANAFLFSSLILMLNVGLWHFAREKKQTALFKFSLLSLLPTLAFFFLGVISEGAYGASFTPAVFFWALIPVIVMIAVGRCILYMIQRKNINM